MAASGVPHNTEIADAFDEMAELLAIRGENPFRIRAYQRAAQVIRTLPRPLAELRGTNEFDELPGIGSDLARKIEELLRTGHLAALERLRRQVPPGLRALLQLPTLGPVRVRALHAQLGIRDVDDLRAALAAGKLTGLRGFGKVLRERLQQAVAARGVKTLGSPRTAEGGAPSTPPPPEPRRWPWTVAGEFAEPLRDYLLAMPAVIAVEIAGSYRRGRDTVGDLDFVVAGRAGLDLPAALRKYPELHSLEAAGPTRCTAVLRNGMQVDLRAVRKASFGSAVYYFTGSRAHNIRVRRRAQERGLKLNEYGLFRGKKRIAGATEREMLTALDLPWIPPELREDRGEIEAAEQGTLPRLVERADLRGDLHVHTRASDGHASLTDMVEAARGAGLRYIAITDHSRHLGIVRGLDAARLSKQIDEIDALNARLSGFSVLKGVEVDILEDGRLALPDDILGRLDVVVAAIHGHFNLSEARQTARILRALERPSLSILAHPTARLLGERAPMAMDFDKVLEAVRARGCCLELNSQPARLDLDDLMVRSARQQGVLLSIASDAHSTTDFANLDLGIRQARRGWLSAADVLNTRPFREVRSLLGGQRPTSLSPRGRPYDHSGQERSPA